MTKYIAPTPPLTDIPDPSDVFRHPGQADYLRRLVNSLKTYISGAVTENTAAGGILLTSPSGAVYQVTVDDTGLLTTTHIRG